MFFDHRLARRPVASQPQADAAPHGLQLEALEPRILLTTLVGGDVFEFLNIDDPSGDPDPEDNRVRVTVTGDVVVELIAVTPDQNNAPLLGNIPGVIVESAIGRDTEILGGLGGQDGIELIGPTDITGSPLGIDFVFDPAGNEAITLDALASDDDTGRTFAFNRAAGTDPGGDEVQVLQLVELNNTTGAGTVVAELAPSLGVFNDGAEPPTEQPAESVLAADFNPDDGLLYFIARGDNGSGEVTDFLFTVDAINAGLGTTATLVAQINPPDTDSPITSIAFEEGPGGVTLYGFRDEGDGGEIVVINLTPPVDPTVDPVVGEVIADRILPVFLDGEGLTGVTGIEFVRDDPLSDADRLIAIAGEQLVEIDLNTGFAISFGPLPDPDDLDDPIRGSSLGGIAWNPTVLNPFTGETGALIATDTESDELVVLDDRNRFPRANLFALYVAQGDPNGSISITILENTDGAGPFPEDRPFIDQGRTFSFTPAQPGDLINVTPSGSGGVLIGGQTADINPDIDDEENRFILAADFLQELGVRPRGADDFPDVDGATVSAGMVVAENLLEFLSASPSLGDRLVGSNLDLVRELAVSRDGQDIVAIDSDRSTLDGSEIGGDELALIDPATGRAFRLDATLTLDRFRDLTGAAPNFLTPAGVNDLTLTLQNGLGINIDFDPDTITTIGDLIAQFNAQVNAAAPGAATLGVNAFNQFVVTDNTVGGITLSVTNAGGSTVATDLGINTDDGGPGDDDGGADGVITGARLFSPAITDGTDALVGVQGLDWGDADFDGTENLFAVYDLGSGPEIGTIDITTGVFTPLGGPLQDIAGRGILGITAMAFNNATGTIFLTDGVGRIHEADASTGAITASANLVAANGEDISQFIIESMDFTGSPTGANLVAQDRFSGRLVDIDLSTFRIEATTALDSLGGGFIDNPGGADLFLAVQSGFTFGVDLTGATTVNDVIAAINTDTAGNVTASFDAGLGTLVLTDNTAGGATFSASNLGGSNAATILGINTQDGGAGDQDGAADGIITGTPTVTIAGEVITSDGSLRPTVGAISFDPAAGRFLAIDNAFSLSTLANESVTGPGANESAALMSLAGFASDSALPQDLLNVLIAGTLTGRVDVSGSVDLFYAGWLITGNSNGVGEGASPDASFDSIPGPGNPGVTLPGATDNFRIGGDLRNLVTTGAIGGFDGAAPDEPELLTLTDIEVGGRLGQAVSLQGSFFGKANVVADNGAPGLSLEEGVIREIEGEAIDGSDASSDEANNFRNFDLFAEDLRFNNDSFDTAQRLGAIRSAATGEDLIRVQGNLLSDGVIGEERDDDVDFFAVGLLAGQTVEVQLSQIGGADPVAVGVFDPDGRLIASSYNNVNSANFLDAPFTFTADRPGEYFFAVAFAGNRNPLFEAEDGIAGQADYLLSIRGIGEVTLGGIVSRNDIFNHLPGLPLVELQRGHLGSIFATNFILAESGAAFDFVAQTGQLRSFDAEEIGQIVGDATSRTLSDSVVIGAGGDIGLVRGRNAGNVFDGGAFVQVVSGGDVQAVIAGDRPDADTANASVLLVNLTANGGLGLIRTGDLGVDDATGSITVNADNTGRDGIIDLIDVDGDYGTLLAGGTPITTNDGGDVRFVRVGGAIFQDQFFAPGVFGNIQPGPGRATDPIEDDGGGEIIIRPTLLGNEPTDFTAEPDFLGNFPPVPRELFVRTLGIRGGGVVVVDVASTGGVTVIGNDNGFGRPVDIGTLRAAETEVIGREVVLNAQGVPQLDPTDPDTSLRVRINGVGDTAVNVLRVEGRTGLTGDGDIAGNFSSIINNTTGEIVSVAARHVGTVSGVGNVGMGRSESGVALLGNQILSDTFPFAEQRTGIQVTGNLVTVRSDAAVGTVIATGENQAGDGHIGQVIANADGLDDAERFPDGGLTTTFEGIAGAVFAAGNIQSVNIGQGLAPSGSGNLAHAGLFALGSINLVTNAGNTGSILYGDIEAAGQVLNGLRTTSGVGDITLTDGASIVGADISGSIVDADLDGNVDNLGGTRNLPIASAASADVGDITLTGNGGIINSSVSGLNLGDIRVQGGFGIFGSVLGVTIGFGDGFTGDIVTDGFGFRGNDLSAGVELGDLIATGRGDLISIASFTEAVRLAELGASAVLPEGHVAGIIADSRTDLRAFITQTRTLETVADADTPTNVLGGGAGLGTAAGDDIQITLADGAVLTADLSGAATLGEVISRIEAAAGNKLRVGFSDEGGELVLTDRTTGDTAFQVANLAGSTAATDLGIAATDGGFGDADTTADGVITGQPLQTAATGVGDFDRSGLIEGSVVRGLGDIVGRVEAFQILDSEINFANSIRSITTLDIIDGLQVRTGDLRDFRPGSDVFDLDLNVAGILRLVRINGDLGDDSVIKATGPNGRLEQLIVTGSVDGDIESANGINTIQIGGDLSGSITVVGPDSRGIALNRLTLGGSLGEGSLDLNGDVRVIDIAGSLGGEATPGQPALEDQLLVRGDLGLLRVGADRRADGAVLALDVVVLGDLGTLSVDGRLSGDVLVTGDARSITVTADGTSERITIVGNNARDQSIVVAGTLSAFSVRGGNVGDGLEDFTVEIAAGGDLQRFDINGGDLNADASVASSTGDIRSFTVITDRLNTLARGAIGDLGGDFDIADLTVLPDGRVVVVNQSGGNFELRELLLSDGGSGVMGLGLSLGLLRTGAGDPITDVQAIDADPATGNLIVVGIDAVTSATDPQVFIIDPATGQAASFTALTRSLSADLSVALLTAGFNDDGAGAELRLALQDGSTVDVELSDAQTLGDILDAINTQSGGSVTATINGAGDGITLADNTAGVGTFTVSDLGAATVATDLGIATADGGPGDQDAAADGTIQGAAVALTEPAITALAADPRFGSVFGISRFDLGGEMADQLVTIDPATGQLTVVGLVQIDGQNTAIAGMDFDARGTLHAADVSTDGERRSITIDTRSPELRSIATSAFEGDASQFRGVAADADGVFLSIFDNDADDNRVLRSVGGAFGDVTADAGEISSFNVRGSDLGGVVNAQSVRSFRLDGSILEGGALVADDAISVSVGHDLAAGGRIALGDARVVSIGNNLDGSVTVEASSSRLTVDARNRLAGVIDITGEASVRVGADMLQGASIRIDGDALGVDLRGDLGGDVIVTGSARSISADSITDAVITVGRDLDRFTVRNGVANTLVQVGIDPGDDMRFGTGDQGEASRMGVLGNFRAGAVTDSVIAAGGSIRRFDADGLTDSSLSSGLSLGGAAIDQVMGGIGIGPASDLQILTADGTGVFADLDGVQTIGDVLDAINAAAADAGVDLVASINLTGDGLQLTDNTVGGGTLTVFNGPGSTAATDLGLAGTDGGMGDRDGVTDGVLFGADLADIRLFSDTPLSALTIATPLADAAARSAALGDTGRTLFTGSLESVNIRDTGIVNSILSAGVDPGATGDFTTPSVLTSVTGGRSVIGSITGTVDGTSLLISDTGIVNDRTDGGGARQRVDFDVLAGDLSTNTPLETLQATASDATSTVTVNGITVTVRGATVQVLDDSGTAGRIDTLVITGGDGRATIQVTGGGQIGRVLTADDVEISSFEYDGDIVGDGSDDPDLWIDSGLRTLSFGDMGEAGAADAVDWDGRVGGDILSAAIGRQGPGQFTIGGEVRTLAIGTDPDAPASFGDAIASALAPAPTANITQLATNTGGQTFVFDSDAGTLSEVDTTTGAVIGAPVAVTDVFGGGAVTLDGLDFDATLGRFVAAAEVDDLNPALPVGALGPASGIGTVQAAAVNPVNGLIFAVETVDANATPGLDRANLITINPATGVRTVVAPIVDIFGSALVNDGAGATEADNTATFRGLSFTRDGRLFGLIDDANAIRPSGQGAGDGQRAIVQIQTAPVGAATAVIASAVGDPAGVPTLLDGGVTDVFNAFAVNDLDEIFAIRGADELVQVAADGTITPVGTVQVGGGATTISGMGFDASGNLLALDTEGGTSRIISIDTAAPGASIAVNGDGATSSVIDLFAVDRQTTDTVTYGINTDPTLGGQLFRSSGTIEVLGTVDQTTGEFQRLRALTQGDPANPVALEGGLRALTADNPGSGNLFAVSGEGRLLSYDPATGELLADLGVVTDAATGQALDVTAIEFDENTGELIGLDARFDRLVTIDPATGQATPRQEPGDLNADLFTDLAFDPATGQLLTFNDATDQFIEIRDIPTAQVGALSATSFSRVTIEGDYDGRLRATGNSFSVVQIDGGFTGVLSTPGSVQLFDQRNGDFAGSLLVGADVSRFQLTNGDLLAPGIVQVGGELSRFDIRSGADADGDVSGAIVAGSARVIGFDGDLAAGGRIDIAGDAGSLLVDGDLAGRIDAGQASRSLDIRGAVLASGEARILGEARSVSVGAGIAEGGLILVDGEASRVTVRGSHSGLLAVGGDVRAATLDSVTGGILALAGETRSVSLSGNLSSGLLSFGVGIGADGVYNTADDEILGGSAGSVTIRGDVVSSAIVAGVLPAQTAGPGIPADLRAFTGNDALRGVALQSLANVDSAEAGGLVDSRIDRLTVGGRVFAAGSGAAQASVVATADGLGLVRGTGTDTLIVRDFNDPAGPPRVESIQVVSPSEIRVVFSEEVNTGSLVLAEDRNNDGDAADPADTLGTIRLLTTSGALLDSEDGVSLAYSVDAEGRGVLSVLREGGFGDENVEIRLSSDITTGAVLDRTGERSALRDFDRDGVRTLGEDPFGTVLDGNGNGQEGGDRVSIFAPGEIANAFDLALDEAAISLADNSQVNIFSNFTLTDPTAFDTGGDIDIFRFDLEAFEFVSLDLDGAGAGAQMALFFQDDQGTPLDTTDDTFEVLGPNSRLDGGSNLFRALEVDRTGTYFAVVTNPAGSNPLPYELTITRADSDTQLLNLLGNEMPEGASIQYISNAIGDNNNFLGANAPKQLVFIDLDGGISQQVMPGVTFQAFDPLLLDSTFFGLEDALLNGDAGMGVNGVFDNIIDIFTTLPASLGQTLNASFVGSDLAAFNDPSATGLFFTTVDPALNGLNPFTDFTTILVGESNANEPGLFGQASTIDFFNQSKGDEVVVLTESFGGLSSANTVEARLNDFSRALANVIAHELGHTLGLNHTELLIIGDDPDNDPLTADDSFVGEINLMSAGPNATLPGDMINSLWRLGTSPIEAEEFPRGGPDDTPTLGHNDIIDQLLRALT